MPDLRSWAPLGVGLVVAAALTIAFSNLVLGAAAGAFATIILFWEQRAARRGGRRE
jgi:MFS superfamily sulfate permease-like transporter